MSIKIGGNSINDLKLGSTQVREVYIGTTKVWPDIIVYTYVVSNVVVYYSSGSTIYANASNYAYALGTVQIYRNGTLVETKTNEPLTPDTLGNSTNFWIDGTYVKGNHLGTSYFPYGNTTSVTWKYLTSTPVSGANVTQQRNIIESTDTPSWSYGPKVVYNSENQNRNYSASVSASAYTSASSPAPGNGGSFTVSGSGAHDVYLHTWYTRSMSRTLTHTWTSGSPSYEPQSDTYYGEDDTWQSRPEYSLIVSSSVAWISISGTSATISANSGSARNATISVSNNGATDSKTIYQAIGYYLSLASSSDSVANTGGSGNVAISTNGTPQLVDSDSVFSIVGSNLHFSVGQNPTSSRRKFYATVRLAEDNTKTASFTLTQNASTITYRVVLSTNSNNIPATGGSITLSATGYIKVNDTETPYELSASDVSWNDSSSPFTRSGFVVSATNAGETPTRAFGYQISWSGASSGVVIIEQANSWSHTAIRLLLNGYDQDKSISYVSQTVTAASQVKKEWTSGSEEWQSLGTVSISGSGFSLSGNTITASQNSGTSSRVCTVTTTYGLLSTSHTITQEAIVSITITLKGPVPGATILRDWYPIGITANLTRSISQDVTINIGGLTITKTDQTVETVTNSAHQGSLVIPAGETIQSQSLVIQYPGISSAYRFANGDKVKVITTLPEHCDTMTLVEDTVQLS